MNLGKFSLCVFACLEVCLCLVVLATVLPAAVKAGNLMAAGVAVFSAVPWSLVGATGLALWRFVSQRKRRD